MASAPIGTDSRNPDACDYETRVECPHCAELVEPEDLVYWDGGRDSTTGYHDVNTGCVCCVLAPLPQRF